MSELTQEQVIAYISGMSRAEAAALIAALEGALGLEVSLSLPAPIAATYGPPDTGAPYEVDVVLDGVSGRRIDVLRAVRRVVGLGLREAQAAVDGAPVVLREAVERERAEEMRAELVEAGADVTLR